MMKFIKPFKGCKQGDLYPTQFVEGDECPDELLDAAKEVGAVDVKPAPRKAKENATDND
ncbi:hypothetical protein JHL22_04985 [Advenella sp. WQ 585]|uniref:Uncharacterized protein n=1 Tax=Advenella mandrilli TaxID=2800330 RepID=A0ABS1EFH6_9BURK|nr:hypothetical protein [Advenella mandrilli]MBK1780565.1 hypothetical protein [Advenella mandrilli]